MRRAPLSSTLSNPTCVTDGRSCPLLLPAPAGLTPTRGLGNSVPGSSGRPSRLASTKLLRSPPRSRCAHSPRSSSSCAAKGLRQGGEGATDIGHRGANVHRAIDAQRRKTHPPGWPDRPETRPAVIWMSPPWPAKALATIWLFCKMTNSGSMVILPPVVCRTAPDGGGHLTVAQPHHGLRPHRDIAPIGLGGCGGHGTVVTQEGIGGPDGNAAGIPWPSAFCGDRCRLTQLDGGGPQTNIAPPATPSAFVNRPLAGPEIAIASVAVRVIGAAPAGAEGRAGDQGALREGEGGRGDLDGARRARRWRRALGLCEDATGEAAIRGGAGQGEGLGDGEGDGPPRPGPMVALEIWAPSVRAREVAVTWMAPAAPALASTPRASATMPLGKPSHVPCRPG